MRILVTMAILSAFSFQGFAVEEDLTLKKPVDAAKLEFGWNPDLKLDLTAAYGTSDNVIGQTDGESMTFGSKIKASYSLLQERDEWRNVFEMREATSRTPALPRYVKSSDLLSFNSLYLHKLESNPWIGPYAQLDVKAPAFRGEDVRPTIVTYATPAGNITGDSLRLTDPFEPLRTKESAGFFATLADKEKLKIESRLGVGALQVKAKGLVLADDAATTTIIEVKDLSSYSYGGVEAALSVKYIPYEKTELSLTAETLVPVGYETAVGDDRDEFELADVNIKAILATKVSDRITFNYEASAVKQPLLLEKYQIKTLGTLNFSYD